MTLVGPHVVCEKNSHAMNSSGSICGLWKEHTCNELWWIHMWYVKIIACVFFSLNTGRVIACLFFSYTTYGSTSVIACVFFSQSTYGSTSVIACVLFLLTTPGVISWLFFSHTTYGSISVIEMCVLFRDHTWFHQCHCMCVLFTNNNQSHWNVCSFHIPPMDPPVSLYVCSF